MPERTEAPRGLAALCEAARPAHWIKNLFVVAPLLFSQRFTEGICWWLGALAAAAFCLLSSGTYLINDVCDRRRDRAHPDKCRRPVASGRLSAPAAGAGGAVLLAGGLAVAAVAALLTPAGLWAGADGAPLGGWGVVVWAACYAALSLIYSLWLRSRPIADVILVALGFVLRAMAGAAAIAVPISPWLVVCTFTLCLFIALTKRRAEADDLGGQAGAAVRRTHIVYSRDNLDMMLAVSASMAMLTYALYCVAPATVARFGSAHLIWTLPIVVYGLFRFNLISRSCGGDPVRVLLRDKAMWLVIVAYVTLAALVVAFGSRVRVGLLLDAGGAS